MAILVTGAAGFIGSHLVEHLLQATDEPIVAVDNFNDYYDPALKRANAAVFAGGERVTLVDADLCDRAVMEALFARHSVSRVAHLGAHAGVRRSIRHAELFTRTNVGGTRNLLEIARRAKVARFLHVSSSTVYGRGAQAPFREDRPLGEPLTPYGASKQAAEQAVRSCHAQFGLPAVIARPFNVYGPRLRPDLAMSIFARAILAGRPFPVYGDGSMVRDFTHVGDVCRGMTAALHAENVAGEAINLGSGRPVPMSRIIEVLESAFARRARIDYKPAQPGDMPVTHADTSKAERLLGYQARVPLEVGVAEFAEWVKGCE